MRTAHSIHCAASTLGGQRCCKAFGRAFGSAFAELRTELRAGLLQSFSTAHCFEVRHVDSATTYRAHFFSNQSEAGLAGVENSNTESIDHSYLGSIKDQLKVIREDVLYILNEVY